MTYVSIDGAFSKGFIGGYNQISVPAQYSTYLRNCRIENNAIVMRDGFRSFTAGKLGRYRQLKNVGGELYALIQLEQTNEVHLFHILPTNYYDCGVIGTTDVIKTKDDVDIVGVGNMAIVLAKGCKPYYSISGQEVQPISNGEMPSNDGGTAHDELFSSCMGAFYSGHVFINEVQTDNWTKTDPVTGNVETGVDYNKTNRVILSHVVNRDVENRQAEARNFSAQRDADNLKIPYKIICPTTVTGIVGTMQNLYIFCEDSIQYVNQEILGEYASNKTLRSVPLANGYELDNHHMATAAGNFVFFFSRDKHIRTIGYTAGIYDPQIADLSDSEFGIQKWINDNIADYQQDGFAFFNKMDQTVEFHLTSKKAYRWESVRNDVTLIRDLQHQSWLIDTGKYFGAMENFNRSWTATGRYNPVPRYDNGQIPEEIEQTGLAKVVAGGTGGLGYRPTTQDLDIDDPAPTFVSVGQFSYQVEDKYDTTFYMDYDKEPVIEMHPIEFEYDTVNIGLTGKKFDVAEMKLFSGARITGAINIHAGNTRSAYIPEEGKTEIYEGNFRVTVYIDGVKQCEKELEWHNIYDYYKKYQIEVGGPGLKPYNPEDRLTTLEYDRMMFPLDLVLDQSMIRKKGKRIRFKIECATSGADLYLSGLSIEATPLGHFDLADKY